MGEHETGRLAPEPPLLAVGGDDAVEHPAEVRHPDEPLGHRDEVQMIGEQPAHQRGAGADDILREGRALPRGELQKFVHLVAKIAQRRVGVLGETRHLEGQRPFLGEQDGGVDLLFGEVALCVFERELVKRVAALLRQPRFGPVGVEPCRRARELEGDGDLLIDVVEIDETLALHVEEKPATDPLRETRSPLSEIVETFAPQSVGQCASRLGAL